MTEQEQIDSIDFEQKRLNDLSQLNFHIHKFLSDYSLSMSERHRIVFDVLPLIQDAYDGKIKMIPRYRRDMDVYERIERIKELKKRLKIDGGE